MNKWHDLRKDPNDLPLEFKDYLCYFTKLGYRIYPYNERMKQQFMCLVKKGQLIAWKEIDPFII